MDLQAVKAIATDRGVVGAAAAHEVLPPAESLRAFRLRELSFDAANFGRSGSGSSCALCINRRAMAATDMPTTPRGDARELAAADRGVELVQRLGPSFELTGEVGTADDHGFLVYRFISRAFNRFTGRERQAPRAWHF